MKLPERTAHKPLSDAERHATFERQEKVMKMFSDNAKTYIQLSSAAIALTGTFAHSILQVPKDHIVVDVGMVLMWGCFLIAILAGAFYQYLAVKFLEAVLDWDCAEVWGWVEPGTIYGVMLYAFYGGTTVFTAYAIARLWLLK